MHLRLEANAFRWASFFLALMITPSRYLLAGFLALWPSPGFAAGWNDFEREIGHGFRIWKTDSFHVCLSLGNHSAIVCGDPDIGDYDPISGYAFTDKHLLVRTKGAKRSGDSASGFITDWDREHFFIVSKKISNPYRYSPIGPLDRDAFHANPAVPARIQWEYPTRFAADPLRKDDISRPVSIIIAIIASLVVFGPILIWPAIFFFVAWRIYRWVRPKGRDNDK